MKIFLIICMAIFTLVGCFTGFKTWEYGQSSGMGEAGICLLYLVITIILTILDIGALVWCLLI